MNITLARSLILIAVFFSFNMNAQKAEVDLNEKTIQSEDLEIILGEWTGSLTYMDYSSNKPYTMPASLTIAQKKNKNHLLLSFSYPNEPNANSKDKIVVSKNGNKLNKKTVQSKQRLSDGKIQITTEYTGKDNNQTALIRNVYIVGNKQFIIRKDVKFENSDNWLKRNEYNFKR